MRWQTSFFVTVVLLVVGFVPGATQVLCTNPGGSLFLRMQCGPKETPVDPVALGLTGNPFGRRARVTDPFDYTTNSTTFAAVPCLAGSCVCTRMGPSGPLYVPCSVDQELKFENVEVAAGQSVLLGFHVNAANETQDCSVFFRPLRINEVTGDAVPLSGLHHLQEHDFFRHRYEPALVRTWLDLPTQGRYTYVMEWNGRSIHQTCRTLSVALVTPTIRISGSLSSPRWRISKGEHAAQPRAGSVGACVTKGAAAQRETLDRTNSITDDSEIYQAWHPACRQTFDP